VTSRRPALLAVVSLACGMAFLGPARAEAQAAAPEVGWWTSNQVAGVPIGRALLVPPGGSQVAAGADGPVSVAAVRFPAGPDGATYRVGVELGSDTEGLTVIACPITGAFEPVHGGPLSDAPAWDCTAAQAVGAVDGDARTIAWDLPSGFVREGVVEAMLLPPDAAASFTLTMSAPGEGSVSPLAAPSPTTSPDPTPTTSVASPRGEPGAAPAVTAPSTGPTAPAPRTLAPSPTAPVGLPSPLPAAPTSDGPDVEVAASVAEDPSSTSGRVLGGLVLAALLAGGALASRRAPTPADAGAGGRGVGRFVRPRAEPPVPI